MVNPMSLEGKRFLVTGASSGIGRATAMLLSQLGAAVVLTARRADALEETRARMENPDAHQVLPGDLADAAFAGELVAAARAAGPLDGLVHAAGGCRALPVGVADARLIASSLEVNYTAFLLLMRHLARTGGIGAGFSAVAVSSVASTAGWAGGSLYAGSKGALDAAVRALAIELAPKGARVNAVCPAQVRTPLLDGLLAGKSEAAVAELAARQPLGFGEPAQVASVIAFLLGGAASFVTGVTLPVDGGYLAG